MNGYLVVADFDGTLANTSKNSPNGMNVHKAYDLAVLSVFGPEGMLAYERIGRLKNREPGELVKILQAETGRYDVSWQELTEALVNEKLGHLIPEINPDWPELYPGVKEFLQGITHGRYFIDSIAIVSSGHDFFIKRVLEVNGINPDSFILVTSDVIRERPMPERPRYKPHPYQLAEAHKIWLEGRSVLPQSDDQNEREPYIGRFLGKPNMLYIGDDPVKDGGLAEGSRIPFIFVPNTNPDFIPDPELGQLRLESFWDLDALLIDHEDELARGREFARVLFDKKDKELFPPPPDGELYRSMMRGERSLV